jgi:O-Antigen ligase
VTALREIGGALGAVRLRRATLEVVVVFVVVVGLAFANGGFFPHTWTVASVGLFWLVALALLLGDEFELGTFDRAWLLLLMALIGWTALSVAWSGSTSVSTLEVRRALVYLAALAAILLITTSSSLVRLLTVVWASSAVVVSYALLRYVLPASSRFDQYQGTLLSRPLGYANALGILAGVAAVLAVGLTAGAPSSRLRMLAAASVPSFAAALYLTGSRASSLAVVVGLAVMVSLERDRTHLAGAVCVLAPAAVLAVALSDRSKLIQETTTGAAADRAGYLLALSIVVLSAAAAYASRGADRIGRRIAGLSFSGRTLTIAALAAVVAGAVVVGLAWTGRFTNEGYRPTYWHVAWLEYSAHPWLGSGAGTFGDYWLRYGIPGAAGGALDAHNLYLETLAELGPVGLALLVATLALPLVAAARVRPGPLVAAAVGAYAALLAHAALDWDWEMPAVMLVGLFCAAGIVASARGAPPAGKLSRRTQAGAFALAFALALFALVAQIS